MYKFKKIIRDEYAQWRVTLERIEDGLNYTLDVWFDSCKELLTDWNQYIFFLNNWEDVARHQVQESVDEFEAASEVAIQALVDLGEIARHVDTCLITEHDWLYGDY